MNDITSSPESARQGLIERGYADPKVARAMQAFRQASLRVPPVQSVARSQVRFSAGAN